MRSSQSDRTGIRWPYGQKYRDCGPLPNTRWCEPETARRLRAIGELLRVLHDAAGYPPASLLAEHVGVVQTTVSNVLSGRRLPTWDTVRDVGYRLAELARDFEIADGVGDDERTDPDHVVRVLHEAYVARYLDATDAS